MCDHSSCRPQKKGYFDLESVEIRRCGQHKNKLAALNIISNEAFVKDHFGNYFRRSSINSSYGTAIKISNWNLFQVSESILFDSIENSILVENGQKIDIIDNKIVNVNSGKNLINNDTSDPRFLYGIRVISEKFLDEADIKIKDNHVSSIESFGVAYSTPGYKCSQKFNSNTNYILYRNQAHSCDVGWLGTTSLGESDEDTCVKFGNFILYKNRQFGFFYLGANLTVILHDSALFDNRANFSARVVLKNQSTPSIKLEKCLIQGTHFPNIEELNQEEECRTDGIVLPSFSIGKIDYDLKQSNLPLNKPVPDEMIWGKLILEDTSFENFNSRNQVSEKCDSYLIVVKNIFFSIPNTIIFEESNIEFSSKDSVLFDDSKIYEKDSICNTSNTCSGYKNVLFYSYEKTDDEELKFKNSFYHVQNKDIQDTNCEILEESNLLMCNSNNGQIIITKSDYNTKKVHFSLEIEAKESGKKDPILHHNIEGINQVGGIVKINCDNQLEFKDKLRSNIDLYLKTENNKDLATFKINMDDSHSVSVYKENTKIDMLILINEDISDSVDTLCGKNYINSQNKELSIILDGSDSCRVTLKFVKALKTSIKVLSNIDYFLKNDGVTKLTTFLNNSLGISEDKINITQIQGQEPIIIFFEIQSDKEASEHELEMLFCKLGHQLQLPKKNFSFEIVDNLGTPTLLLGEGIKKAFYNECVMNSNDNVICSEFSNIDQNECQKCRKGFYLDISENSETKKKCLQITKKNCLTTNPNEDKCEKCPPDFYLDEGDSNCKHLTPVTNCIQYEVKKDGCLYCEESKYFNNIKKECQQVKEIIENCIYYNSDQGCDQCHDKYYPSKERECKEGKIEDCLTYKDEYICTKCKDFYKIESGKCKFLEGCEKLEKGESSICKECKTNYYLDQKQTNCIKRNNTYKCKELNPYSDECISCVDDEEDNFFISEDKKNCELQDIVSNCKEYFKEKNECKWCAKDFFRHENENKCKVVENKVEKCYIYKEDGKCEICEETFVESKGRCMLGYINGCQYYKTINKCKSCYHTHFLEEETFHCKEYSSNLNCKKNDPNKDKCKECFLKQQFNDMGECENIPNCDEFEPGTNNCIRCNSKFYLNTGDNTCYEREQINCRTFLENDDECESCKDKFYLDMVDGNKCKSHDDVEHCAFYNKYENVCEGCKSGYFLKDKKCVLLENVDLKCQDYISQGKCKKCFEGYYLELNKCKPGTISNCKIYIDETQCEYCNHGYYLTDHKCVSYSSEMNCEEYHERKDECLTCFPKYRKTKINRCQYIENCKIFSNDQTQCEECIHDYYLDFQTCTKRKNKTCKTYKINADKCETCKEKKYLDFENSDTCKEREGEYLNCKDFHPFYNKCKECEANFILANGICYKGEENIENCIAYKDGKCSNCGDGFKLSQDKKCIQNTCNKADTKGNCTECVDDHYLTKEDSESTSDSNSDLVKSICKKYSYHKNCDSLVKDKDQCEICSFGYFLDNENSCQKSTKNENCKKMKVNEDKCEVCSTRFKLDEDERCVFDESTIKPYNYFCDYLKDPYILETISKKCSSDQPGNCSIHNKKNKCLLCEQKYYLNKEFNDTCFKVTDNNCEENIPNENLCKKCINGFLLKDNICTPEQIDQKKELNLRTYQILTYVFISISGVLFLFLFLYFLIKLCKKRQKNQNRASLEPQRYSTQEILKTDSVQNNLNREQNIVQIELGEKN